MPSPAPSQEGGAPFERTLFERAKVNVLAPSTLLPPTVRRVYVRHEEPLPLGGGGGG